MARRNRGPANTPMAMLQQQHDRLEGRMRKMERQRILTSQIYAPDDGIDPVEGEHIIDPEDDAHAWYSNGAWHKASEKFIKYPMFAVPMMIDTVGFDYSQAPTALKFPGGMTGIRASGEWGTGSAPVRRDSVTGRPIINGYVEFTAQDAGLKIDQNYGILVGYRVNDVGDDILVTAPNLGTDHSIKDEGKNTWTPYNNFGYTSVGSGLPNGYGEYNIDALDDIFRFETVGDIMLDWILLIPKHFPNGAGTTFYFHSGQTIVDSPTDGDMLDTADPSSSGVNGIYYETQVASSIIDPSLVVSEANYGDEVYVFTHPVAMYLLTIMARTFVSDSYETHDPLEAQYCVPAFFTVFENGSPTYSCLIPGSQAWIPIVAGPVLPAITNLSFAPYIADGTYLWGTYEPTVQIRTERYMFVAMRHANSQ